MKEIVCKCCRRVPSSLRSLGVVRYHIEVCNVLNIPRWQPSAPTCGVAYLFDWCYYASPALASYEPGGVDAFSPLSQTSRLLVIIASRNWALDFSSSSPQDVTSARTQRGWSTNVAHVLQNGTLLSFKSHPDDQELGDLVHRGIACPLPVSSSLHDQRHEALHACTYKVSKATPYSPEPSQPTMQFFFTAILTLSSMLLQAQAMPLGSPDTALQARSCAGEHTIKLPAHRDHLTHTSRLHHHSGFLLQSWNCHLFMHEHFQGLQGCSMPHLICGGKEYVFI